MKNKLEGICHRSEDAEEQMSTVEVRVVEITQAEQQQQKEL